MSDLTIFGKTFTDVKGIKATDTDGNEVVYGGGYSYDEIASRSISGDVELNVTNVSPWAFNGSQITSVSSDTVTNVQSQAFSACNSLVSVSFPNLSGIVYGSAFSNNPNLETIEMSGLDYLSGGYVFTNDRKLKRAMFPNFGHSGGSRRTGLGVFTNCASLEAVDLGACSGIDGDCFNGCNVLQTVVLRRSSDVCTLGTVGAFNNTPMRGYGGAFSGHVYVPQALISTYQTAKNWATLYANYPDIFQPIEGSIYE